MKKTLVAGWFSFENMGATAGDLITRDVVCRWLEEAGAQYDVALSAQFTGGVDWTQVDPGAYSRVVFVCGPFGNGWPIPDFLSRFTACQLLGVNLSMVDPVESWNPFDVLLERDSSRTRRPDLVFLAPSGRVPVVGVVLVHAQTEYGERTRHLEAHAAIERLLKSRPAAVVPIDTRLDINATGLRTPAEVESLIARMDLVVTTRLHGTVLALKNGVPALVIDPIAGGAKIRPQMEAIGWPVLFTADTLADGDLQQAFDYCLTDEARARARKCAAAAAQQLEAVRLEFVTGIQRQTVGRGAD